MADDRDVHNLRHFRDQLQVESDSRTFPVNRGDEHLPDAELDSEKTLDLQNDMEARYRVMRIARSPFAISTTARAGHSSSRRSSRGTSRSA